MSRLRDVFIHSGAYGARVADEHPTGPAKQPAPPRRQPEPRRRDHSGRRPTRTSSNGASDA